MRNVLVRVVDSGGRPVSNARVAFGTYGLNHGVLPAKQTNSSGEAEFNIGDYGDVCVYVNGQEVIGRTPIQGTFRVQL